MLSITLLLPLLALLRPGTPQQYQQFGQQPQYNAEGQYSPQSQYNPQGYNPQGYNQGQYQPPTARDPQSRWQYGNQGPYTVGQTQQRQQPQQPQQPQYRGQYDQQTNYGQPTYNRDENCCEEYCYKQDEQKYVFFGSKTAYTYVYGNRIKDHIVPHCKPIQFWSINRHGTRFPSSQKMSRLRELQRIHDEVVRNYEERRSFPDKGRLCNEDFDLLKMWRWNDSLTPDMGNALTRQGIDDLKFLARRTQTRFRELLAVPYSDSYYFFKYTDTDRTHDSYQAYIEGLFQNQAYQVHASIQRDDPLERPDQTCSAWRQHVDDNPDTLGEYQRFREGREYKEMVRAVFRRLGFRYNLNSTLIEDIYDMCRFEKAWYVNKDSPWCAAFTKEHLKLLEYATDLYDYYYAGHGNELAKKIGCSPAKDLYERFQRTVNGDRNGQKVVIYFTHSTPFQSLLTTLGIAKDNIPLTADNYHQQNYRKWRTSKLAPFAANLAAVLYQCEQEEPYRVMFFLNEEPVDYPGCAVGLCSWNNIQNTLRQISDNCNLDFCERGSSSSLQSNYFVLVSVIAVAMTKSMFYYAN